MQTSPSESGIITAQNILKLPYYAVRGLLYHAAGTLYTPKPFAASFLITRRCNSKCIMCSDWKTGNSNGEMTLEEFQNVLADPLLKDIKGVIFSGGEPTLRDDLVEIVQSALNTNSKLKWIALTTNGLMPETVFEKVKSMSELIEARSKNFLVTISIHGYGKIHERVVGIPGSFESVTRTIGMLKELQKKCYFDLRLCCVIQSLNIDNIQSLLDFSRESNLPLNFLPVCISDAVFNNTAARKQLALNSHMLREPQFLNTMTQSNLANMVFWEDCVRIAQGHRRAVPCAMVRHFLMIDSDGTVFICARDSSLTYGNIRKASIGSIWHSEKADETRKRAEDAICPGCNQRCNVDFALSHEFFYILRYLTKQKLGKIIRRASGSES